MNRNRMSQTDFMRRALRLAARGRTSPNPMVGAVVVRDGVIVGEGFHPKAGEPHAEVFALETAGDQADGAILYVTLEPCCHHGRTPPCAEAVIHSGVKRVVVAMEDPNPVVSGTGIKALHKAGIEVEVGLLEDKARRLNEGYVKRVTVGLPFVVWKAAMTLDGKIATRSGDSRWVTGEMARRAVHRLRSRSDAVMVGIGTVLADDPELTVRHAKGMSPLRVVVDSEGRVPLDARVLNSEAPTIVVTRRSAPEANLDRLWSAGVRVLGVRDVKGRIDLGYLMGELAKMGINTVLLESGGELAASMIAGGLVDRGLLFIAPKIAGGRDAKTPVEGEGVELMDQALPVSRPAVRRFGDDLALEFCFPKTAETANGGHGDDVCLPD
jgi:diaminohydroxyphosphoribosylaminopyrimidine deaminase / 5-amino-6-(5-phosphoribosylamino)uracil reductase